MTGADALRYVEEAGIVLASAQGPVARLCEVIAGEPIRGSWWAHDKSHEIYRVFAILGESPDILVCRLVLGKVTFVHRRIWPAMIRLADRFPPSWLAKIKDEHTNRGHHRRHEVPYPLWTDAASVGQAEQMSDREALTVLGAWAAQAIRPS